MECFWCLFRHWKPDGHCYQQHPEIFYVHLSTDDGIPDYYLYGAGILEKYEKIYLGGEEKSMVLFIA